MTMLIKKGKTFSRVLRPTAPPYIYKPITAITKAAPAGEKTGLAAAQTGEPRKSAAVAKNLAAAAAQPGNLKEAGMDSDKAGQTKATPAAGDLTLEEYDALPEATRAKMRGDFA